MARNANEPSDISNGVTDMNSRYLMTRQEARAFMHELSEPSFLDNVAKLYQDPIENVISMMCFPFDFKNVSIPFAALCEHTSSIIVSIVVLKATASYLGYTTMPLLDLGNVTIKPYFNSFLDYAPYTKIEIFLPYIGFEELDPALVLGKKLSIKYSVDLYTGRCTAFLSVFDKGQDTIIMTRDGQIGLKLQIAGGNGAELARNMLGAGIRAATGAISMGAAVPAAISAPISPTVAGAGFGIGMINYLGSTTNQAIAASQLNVVKGSAAQGNNGFYGPQNAYLIYTRPVIARPDSYNSNMGRPSGKTCKLSDLTGYTTIDKVHIEGEGLSQATKTELDMIAQSLNKGIIL